MLGILPGADLGRVAVAADGRADVRGRDGGIGQPATADADGEPQEERPSEE
jgi:hypothetical protein